MFKSYTPFEYLLIDIANAFGLDKLLFEQRIEWVKSNIHNLEAFQGNSDDPALYCKAVLALRKVQAGKPTGHLVSLDSVCSGIQLMSAMTGCKSGCAATGLVENGTRADCYTLITVAANELLQEDGVEAISVSRPQAKEAVMTAAYGSTAIPEEIFGEYVDYFYAAAHEVAPAAFELMPVLVKSWDKKALAHEWVIPDGHQVYIPTMVKGETRIRIDELDGASITIQYKDNQAAPYSKANCANAIHSVDALVLRNMIRRCSYDASVVEHVSDMLTMHIMLPMKGDRVDPELERLIQLSQESEWVDPVFFNILHEENMWMIPTSLAQKLNALASKMLEYPSFNMLTVHDAFRVSPRHADRTRWWYKEILAELAESEMVNFIGRQLGIKGNFEKYGDVADLIRNSNYGIC